MIRFRIAGSGYLELPSDFDFSFNFNNGIFAFENMQLSRSGEFIIPRTPANDVILGFSHDPSNHGLDVRRTIRAELFYSGGKINGSLFIGKYTAGTGYSAVFVYGELSGLKRIQELGTIDNYAVVNGDREVNPPLESAYTTDGLLDASFSFYKYNDGIPDASKLTTHFNHFPTVKLSYLLSQASISAGVTVDTSVLGVAVDAVGLILSTNNANPTLQSVSVTGAANLSLAISGGGAILFDVETRPFAYFVFDYQSRELHSANIRVLVCKDDLTLVTSVGSNSTAIITADGTFDGSTYGASGITYLSDGDIYGFRHIYEGQRIALNKGDFFTFIHAADTRNSYPINAYTTPIAPGVTFDVYAGELESVDVNEDYYLQYNLPKVTLLDLVKTFANIFYCGITYDAGTNTIGFFDFNFNKSNRKKLDDDVIAIKSVSRSFYDYAQKNYIKYKNEDYVLKSNADIIYSINNDSLPKEKTLFTVPFSEGIKNELGEVVLNDFELVAPYKKTAKIGTLAVPSVVSGENNLKHISELYNYQYVDKTSPWTNNLTPIIQNSTTVEMTVKMDVANFLNMENEDVYSYRGKDYVCISGSHSGLIANLTLIKI